MHDYSACDDDSCPPDLGTCEIPISRHPGGIPIPSKRRKGFLSTGCEKGFAHLGGFAHLR